ncbi:MAG: HEAT repeat domain-containing protein [Candidatus Hodarchaeales archaeon]|jgi:HEAT repeat protein
MIHPANPCVRNKSSAACKKWQEVDKALRLGIKELKEADPNLVKNEAMKVLADIMVDEFTRGLKRFADKVTCIATFGNVCPKPKSVRESALEAYDMMSKTIDAKQAKKVVPYLIKALRDSDPKEAIRQSALEALFKIQTKKVAPYLIKALGDSVPKEAIPEIKKILEQK